QEAARDPHGLRQGRRGAVGLQGAARQDAVRARRPAQGRREGSAGHRAVQAADQDPHHGSERAAMKAKDLRDKAQGELQSMEKELTRELWKTRFSNFTNQLDDTAKLR